jgi:AhpD family alkylhydroperoxidase
MDPIRVAQSALPKWLLVDLNSGCVKCLALVEECEQLALSDKVQMADSLMKALLVASASVQRLPLLLTAIFREDLAECSDPQVLLRGQQASLLCLKALFQLLDGRAMVRRIVRRPVLTLMAACDGKSSSATSRRRKTGSWSGSKRGLSNGGKLSGSKHDSSICSSGGGSGDAPCDSSSEQLVDLTRSVLQRCFKEILGLKMRKHTDKQAVCTPGKQRYAMFACVFGEALRLLDAAIKDEFEVSTVPTDVITSSFFLRFVTPCVASPMHWSVTTRRPSPLQATCLTVAAKLLQSVANGMPLSDTELSAYNERAGLSLRADTLNPTLSALSDAARRFIAGLARATSVRGCDTVLVSMGMSVGEAVSTLETHVKAVVQLQGGASLAWTPHISACLARPASKSEISDMLAGIRDQQRASYGFVLAPLEPHECIPGLFGAVWCMQREIAGVRHSVAPVIKEVVQAAVSVINHCQLCVDLHTTTAIGLGIPYEVVYPLIRGKPLPAVPSGVLPVSSRTLQQYVAWARASCMENHFLTIQPPFTTTEAPEVMGSALLKHYFNRITNTFLREFTRLKGKRLKGVVFRKRGTAVQAAAKLPKIPGKAFCFANDYGTAARFGFTADEGPLPVPASSAPSSPQSETPETGALDEAFSWARSNPYVAESIRRWQLVEERLAEECVPPAVRKVLREALTGWNGHRALSQEMFERVAVTLSAGEKVIARLAVTIACDPARVSRALTRKFRALFPPESASHMLFATCSYAAFCACKQLSSFWCLPGDADRFLTRLSAPPITPSLSLSAAKLQPIGLSLPASTHQSGGTQPRSTPWYQVRLCDGPLPPIQVFRRGADRSLVVQVLTLSPDTSTALDGPFLSNVDRHPYLQLTMHFGKLTPEEAQLLHSTAPRGTVVIDVPVPALYDARLDHVLVDQTSNLVEVCLSRKDHHEEEELSEIASSSGDES